MGADWLLNYTALGLSPQSSINFWFWFNPFDVYARIWASNAYTALQSLLAFIIWECCPNNSGNPLVASQDSESLPAVFHTTASVTELYTKFVLNVTTFIIYLILEIIALVFCWGVVIWQVVSKYFGRSLSIISSFPQVDFAAKLCRKAGIDDANFLPLCPQVSAASGDAEIRDLLANVEVLASHQEPRHLGLNTHTVRPRENPQAETSQAAFTHKNSLGAEDRSLHASRSTHRYEDNVPPIDRHTPRESGRLSNVAYLHDPDYGPPIRTVMNAGSDYASPLGPIMTPSDRVTI